jgi:hypothetical protein
MGGKGADVRPVGAVAFYSAFLAYHRFYDENNTESVWAGGTPGIRSVVCVCVQLYMGFHQKKWPHSWCIYTEYVSSECTHAPPH